VNKTLAKLTGHRTSGSRNPKTNWRRMRKAEVAMLQSVCKEVARAKDETDITFPEGAPEIQFYTLAGAFMDALTHTGSVSKAYLQIYPHASVRRRNHPRTHGNELLELIKSYFPTVGAYMREWCYRIGVTPPFLVNQLRELATSGAQDNVRLQATKALITLMDLDSPDKALPVVLAQLDQPAAAEPPEGAPPVEAAEEDPLEAEVPLEDEQPPLKISEEVA